MQDLNAIEKKLLLQLQRELGGLQKKNLDVQKFDPSSIKNLTVAFKDKEGRPQRGKLFRFGKVIPESNGAKVELWDAENSKGVYKELVKLNMFDVRESGDLIQVELKKSTMEDREKNLKLINNNLADFDLKCKFIKKGMRTHFKTMKESKDTIRALENMTEDNIKEYSQKARKNCEETKARILKLN